jgi:hypothetical protein
MMKKLLLLALALALVTGAAAAADQAKKGPGKGVFFVEPKNGAVVGTEFKVVMGVKGMDIKPAGEMVENAGHHHLLIDTDPVDLGKVIPADDKHVHFGKGQTETTVKLAPGKHKLQLQFADGAHRSYGEAMRATVDVTVK